MKNIFDGSEFKKLTAPQVEVIKEISEHISVVTKHVEEMTDERKKANNITDHKKQAELIIAAFIGSFRHNCAQCCKDCPYAKKQDCPAKYAMYYQCIIHIDKFDAKIRCCSHGLHRFNLKIYF